MRTAFFSRVKSANVLPFWLGTTHTHVEIQGNSWITVSTTTVFSGFRSLFPSTVLPCHNTPLHTHNAADKRKARRITSRQIPQNRTKMETPSPVNVNGNVGRFSLVFGLPAGAPAEQMLYKNTTKNRFARGCNLALFTNHAASELYSVSLVILQAPQTLHSLWLFDSHMCGFSSATFKR